MKHRRHIRVYIVFFENLQLKDVYLKIYPKQYIMQQYNELKNILKTKMRNQEIFLFTA